MHGMPPGAHDAEKLSEHTDLILDVLKHLIGNDDVEAVIFEWQFTF